MGAIMKAFAARSSHSAKKDGVWEDIIERLNECQSQNDVTEFEEWVKVANWNLPYPYREPLADEIEAKREAIEADEEVLRRWGS